MNHCASARFIEVDSTTKQTSDGTDYRSLYPLGLVPALRLEDGALLTENAAILQYVAARFPEAKLAPGDALGRARLQQWLCFIGTELHVGLFGPLLDPQAPLASKDYVRQKYTPRLNWLDHQLRGRSFLLDEFSVADGYLVTVLNWSAVTGVDLKQWPALLAYTQRVRARPQVARAIAEELELYRAELARERRTQ